MAMLQTSSQVYFQKIEITEPSPRLILSRKLMRFSRRAAITGMIIYDNSKRNSKVVSHR